MLADSSFTIVRKMRTVTFCTFVILLGGRLVFGAAIDDDYDEGSSFPEDFLFGAATSAYQIEGAWNVSDKGESMWDRFVHTRSDLIRDGSNGDVAADSYHKYKEDIRLVKSIGGNAYRISLSWSRILPNGFPNKISEDGVEYYNNVINEMISNNVTPMITLYHWDLPQRLHELGGWTNPYIIDWIVDYARVAFRLFGDRVKIWNSINEPMIMCNKSYGNDETAPALNQSGIADYLCGHHVLLANAKIYNLYDTEFRPTQNGKIGIVLSCGWYEPKDNSSSADRLAAERALEFDVGWFAHPIFTAEGDYPETMKSRIAERSEQQGYPRSRLPEFTREQIDLVRGTSDFMGVNFYTAIAVRDNDDDSNPGYPYDTGMHHADNDWPGVLWVKNTPWAFAKLLRHIAQEYDPPVMYVTENGYPDMGGVDDRDRTEYFHGYLEVLLGVIEEGINVKGYFAWSLFDNFEWSYGYIPRFGVFEVDYNSTERTRTPKLSSKFLNEVFTTKRIPVTSKYVRGLEDV